jgi:hypothetical protein
MASLADLGWRRPGSAMRRVFLPLHTVRIMTDLLVPMLGNNVSHTVDRAFNRLE